MSAVHNNVLPINKMATLPERSSLDVCVVVVIMQDKHPSLKTHTHTTHYSAIWWDIHL